MEPVPRHKLAMASGVLLVVFVLLALFAPVIEHVLNLDPEDVDLSPGWRARPRTCWGRMTSGATISRACYAADRSRWRSG